LRKLKQDSPGESDVLLSCARHKRSQRAQAQHSELPPCQIFHILSLKMIDDTPMLSRSGVTSPFGCFDHCVRVYLTEADYQALLRMEARMDQVPGELGRDLVSRALHGETMLERIAKHRRNLLDAQGINQSQMKP
jgi:hypothetical protein